MSNWAKPYSKATIILLLAFALLWASASPVASQAPDSPPNSNEGLEIFEVRCANCHGPLGQGNGELAANLPSIPNFADPAWRNTAVPADLFNTISNGRIQNAMPPFGAASSDPISEADRWHLVATLYSFSLNSATLAEGQRLYEATCADCHGPEGGQMATADLTDLQYWFNRSNSTILASLTDPAISQHSYQLSQEELQLITDYARTFSYSYTDPAAPAAAIPIATVSGTIFNGSANQVQLGNQVLLRAFTADFQEQLSVSVQTGPDGRYQFTLNDVMPDCIYIATTDYGDLLFTSNAEQINSAHPTLELPIIVYDKTNDPSIIQIEQVHLIFGFGQDVVEVNELYMIRNMGTAVFMGQSGNVNNGTIEFVLPTGARNIDFQRAFSNLTSFVPAPEIIPTQTGWADTLPLQPGSTNLSLLVSYQLPYRSGLTIAHPLPYRTNNITAILPDTGVQLTSQNWSAQGSQSLPSGPYLSYNHPPLTAGDALTIQLNGRPRIITDSSGNRITARHQTAELIIGSSALLLVLTAAAYTIRTWQKTTLPQTRQALIQALAQLDDAYEAEQISQRQYQRQRQQLKEKLMSLWQDTA